jgi:hypothetical protein
MTTLQTAAQQALNALSCIEYSFCGITDGPSEDTTEAVITTLRAALAEHDKNLAWFKERKANWDLQRKLAEETQERDRQQALVEDALQRFTDVNQELEAALAEPVQEPPCATRECMPSQCPNCVSLQDQNTELDRKLADLEQTSLELCEVCGWKTLIPGDCCLNCERKHPLGQASTDVPLTVYSVKKAEPVQETCTYKCEAWPECGCASPKAEPVERKPMNEFDALRLVTETVGFLKSAGPVEGLIGIIRAVERAHGIT